MKNISFILKTDLKQNSFHYLAIVLFSFSLGLMSMTAMKAEYAISKMAEIKNWNADLLIVPKGMSIDEIESEIKSGETKAFLPELLYKTTLELVNNAVDIMAIFPVKNKIMVEKNTEQFSSWFSQDLRLTTFSEQSIYQTPEWGNHLMAAVLVKGDKDKIATLKNIIDKKTVAVAIDINEAQKEKIAHAENLKQYLKIAEIAIIVLMLTGLISFIWQIKSIFRNWSQYLFEMGMSRAILMRMQLGIWILFLITPMLLGAMFAHFINVR